MPRIVAVVGGKHSGKTTIVENVIAELKRRGYHVGAVKEMVRIPTLETPNKETDRYFQAGAEVIAAIPRGETVIFIKRRLPLNEILPHFSRVDFVVLEGFETERMLPKIIAAKTAIEARNYLDSSVIAISGPIAESVKEIKKAKDFHLPVLSALSQIIALGDLIAKK